jgi:hypothetical protein
MTSIKISDLHPVGFDLLQDTESFFDELSDQEIETVQGGVNHYYQAQIRTCPGSPYCEDDTGRKGWDK